MAVTQKLYFKNFQKTGEYRAPKKGEYYLANSYQYGTAKSTSAVKYKAGNQDTSYYATKYHIVKPKDGFDPTKITKTFKVTKSEVSVEINGVKYDQKETEDLYDQLAKALGY